MRARYLLLLTLSPGFAQQPAQQSTPPPGPPPIEGKPVDAASLRYIDIVKGTGAPAAPGKKYVVHYTGWLTNGKKFDSSLDRKEPLDFVQGRRQVITGWDIGFEGMNIGGKRRLFIPHQLAYAEKGAGDVIPPNADLIFDVELLDVKDVPPRLPSQELLDPFDEIQSQIMALAQAVPEEKYSWRPAPGIRSFGEVFVHVANGTHLLATIAADQPAADALKKMVEDGEAREKTLTNKPAILAFLTQQFADARKSIADFRAGGLSHDADFFSEHTTVRGILTFLDTHMAEHLGQAIAYSRMNGIVPPWSAPPASAK